MRDRVQRHRWIGDDRDRTAALDEALELGATSLDDGQVARADVHLERRRRLELAHGLLDDALLFDRALESVIGNLRKLKGA